MQRRGCDVVFVVLLEVIENRLFDVAVFYIVALGCTAVLAALGLAFLLLPFEPGTNLLEVLRGDFHFFLNNLVDDSQPNRVGEEASEELVFGHALGRALVFGCLSLDELVWEVAAPVIIHEFSVVLVDIDFVGIALFEQLELLLHEGARAVVGEGLALRFPNVGALGLVVGLLDLKNLRFAEDHLLVGKTDKQQHLILMRVLLPEHIEILLEKIRRQMQLLVFTDPIPEHENELKVVFQVD